MVWEGTMMGAGMLGVALSSLVADDDDEELTWAGAEVLRERDAIGEREGPTLSRLRMSSQRMPPGRREGSASTTRTKKKKGK